tara:strand:- start:1209 stop:1892 length:684 start_codon:yes stop_codon:yes gene_type:complete
VIFGEYSNLRIGIISYKFYLEGWAFAQPFFYLLGNLREDNQMGHNYSKGAQVIGDLKAADDAERNTQIDFGEDQIDLETSGSLRFQVKNGGASTYYDPTQYGNDTGMGEIVKFGTGTLTAGKLYYLNGSSAWAEVDADAVASGADQLLGIALGSDPAGAGVLIRGMFDAHSYLSNFSAGKAVYISATAGGMDTTAPSGGGDFVRIVGYCTNTSNVIYFNPSSTWIEL